MELRVCSRLAIVGTSQLVLTILVHSAWADALPPVVTITAPPANSVLPASGGLFAGTAVDVDGVAVVRVYVFDEFRGFFTVTNAPAVLASTSWSFAVPPAAVSPGGVVRLWVQAADRFGNTSPWQLRRVAVGGVALPPADTQPPTVTITQPAGSPVSPGGFTFGGTVTDASGVSAVRIYVFDESRGVFTVSNAPAVLTGTSWSFAIQPAAVSPGGFVRLWVQASDPVGNTSAWQLSRVLTAGTADLGPSQVSVQGTVLYVSRRRPDGTLEAPAPFKIRGVNYSPVDPGEQVDTLAAARTHLRESRYAEDFVLIQELGANTVRTFADAGTDAIATQILNAAYERKLFVMVSLMDLTPSEVTAVVNAYKRHPALLGWIIGNEWNINRFFDAQRFPALLDAAAAVEQTARLIRSLDADHPVASGLGFSDDGFNLGPEIAQHALPQLLAAAPSVQLWGFNLYRGASVEPFFAEWDLLRTLSGFPRPFLLTEFGTDSWDFSVARLNETLQADTDEFLWDELHRNCAGAYHANPPCVGGFVMEWNDEWWKAGTPSVQDAGGFPLTRTIFHPVTGFPVATFRGHPDGFSNEEHYGLVDMGRRKKQAFFAMQRAFALGTLRTDPVGLEVTAVGNGPPGFMVFAKRGAPVYAGLQDGIYLGVLSLGTGTFETLRRFDTAGDPLNQCLALRDYVRTLSDHDVVLAAVSRSGLPDAATLRHPVVAPCADALLALGSTRVLELGPRQPWALIARAGSSPVNLAEGLATPADAVRITASVFLDADEDGIPDHLDLDNDNDGISDAAERARGTDVLDPSR